MKNLNDHFSKSLVT